MITFIAMHTLPMQHFSDFEKVCQKNGYTTQMLTGEDVYSNMSATIATCRLANTIFVGIGHKWAGDLYKTLKDAYGDSKNIYLYYENPKEDVPGGYSDLFVQIVALHRPKIIVYANKHLAKEEGTFGLGYYPMEQIERIRAARAGVVAREFVYLGSAGNNTLYQEMHSLFIKTIAEIDFTERPTTIIFRKHPRPLAGDWEALEALGAKEGLTVVLDKRSEEETLGRASGAFFCQTSMETKLQLCSIPYVSSIEQLKDLLAGRVEAPDPTKVLAEIGYDPDWEKRLLSLLPKMD